MAVNRDLGHQTQFLKLYLFIFSYFFFPGKKRNKLLKLQVMFSVTCGVYCLLP